MSSFDSPAQKKAARIPLRLCLKKKESPFPSLAGLSVIIHQAVLLARIHDCTVPSHARTGHSDILYRSAPPYSGGTAPASDRTYLLSLATPDVFICCCNYCIVAFTIACSLRYVNFSCPAAVSFPFSAGLLTAAKHIRPLCCCFPLRQMT